jgi:DNA-binding MarR family transcriptional regulator
VPRAPRPAAAKPVPPAIAASSVAPAGVPADPPAFRVLNEIGIIEQLARNRFERVLPPGLSIAQFSVLNHFVRLGGEPSLVALSRAFQVSKPAMGKLVRKLADQGLLGVDDDPADRRGKRVRITAAGVAMRHACIAALGPEVARLQAGLGEDAFASLLPGLARLRQWLDTHR